jgi:putative zinc finger/helix-turn-helix YgiT family protein
MRPTVRERVCSNCGLATTKVRHNAVYHFRESGLSKLELHGIDLIECSNCGNVDPIIGHLDGLMTALAKGITRKKSRLAGEEIRFLRKYIGMTGETLARLLDVDKTTLSKWENDADPIGEQSDRLLRLIASVKGRDLRSEIESTVDSFAEARRRKRGRVRPAQMSIDVEDLELRYA